MNWLRQSTAATLKMGPFLDSTDGDTEETGLTIAYTSVLLSKNGGAIAAKSDTTGATHDANGWYSVPLNTTDTGTLGRLKVYIHVAGALAVWEEYLIVPANVYDSIVLGTDFMQVDTVQVSGTAQTANDNGADINAILEDTGTTIPNQISGLNDLSAAEVNAEVDTALSDYDAATGAELAAVESKIDTIDGNVDSILADTGTTIPAQINGLNDISSAEVNAACDTAISDAALATAAALAVVDSNVDSILIDTGETIPNQILALNDLSAADIRTAIGMAAADLDEQLATLSTFDPEADILENSKSYADMFRIMKAVIAGKSTGAGLVFRDDADTKDRVTVTIDEDKNRTAVTLDGE